jgi:DNA-binding MarR family transcriptional regulator
MTTKKKAAAPAPSAKAAAKAVAAPKPRPPSPEAPARVLRRFRLVFNAVKTHFRQVEKKAGVGGAQVWALSIIRDTPGIGVGELARAMDIHQSTASNLVRSLLDMELVATAKEGADRRAVQLRLLAAGTRVLKRAPGPFTGVLPQALRTLDAPTLARLDRDLGRLIAALGADERDGQVLMADQL